VKDSEANKKDVRKSKSDSLGLECTVPGNDVRHEKNWRQCR
jgi:hypothetical protein